MSRDLIYTERLVMKPLDLSDAPFMLKLVNTPNWLQYIGDRNVYNLEDAKRYLKEGSLKSVEKDGYGYYLLTDVHSNMPVGICGLGKRDGLDETDLGFALLPEAEGRGFAFESSVALIEAAWNKFNLKTLVAITTADNIGCIKLLEKLGFRFQKKAQMNGEGKYFEHFQLTPD